MFAYKRYLMYKTIDVSQEKNELKSILEKLKWFKTLDIAQEKNECQKYLWNIWNEIRFSIHQTYTWMSERLVTTARGTNQGTNS